MEPKPEHAQIAERMHAAITSLMTPKKGESSKATLALLRNAEKPILEEVKRKPTFGEKVRDFFLRKPPKNHYEIRIPLKEPAQGKDSANFKAVNEQVGLLALEQKELFGLKEGRIETGELLDANKKITGLLIKINPKR